MIKIQFQPKFVWRTCNLMDGTVHSRNEVRQQEEKRNDVGEMVTSGGANSAQGSRSCAAAYAHEDHIFKVVLCIHQNVHSGLENSI